MVAADGKGVAVAAENEHVQVRPGERNAAGKRQGAAVDVMHAVRLDEIRKPAGAADARDGGDFSCHSLRFSISLKYSASTEKSPQPGHHVG